MTRPNRNPIIDDLRRAGLMPDGGARGDATRLLVQRRRGRGPAVEHDFLLRPGWSVADAAHEGRACGLVAHRGVLHPDEYVNHELLIVMLEKRLGFTLEELQTVRAGGRPDAAAVALRRRVLGRLTELAAGGANQDLLARVLGIDPDNFSALLRRNR